MANRHRGEIDATIDGVPRRLCLTLGALAELEQAFGVEDMLSLAQRFSSGRIAARDAIRVLGAGLRSGGFQVEDAAVGEMRIEGGAVGAIDVVARLLAATFGGADTDHPGTVGND
jgi:Phage tail tube protein, GTA-gp10